LLLGASPARAHGSFPETKQVLLPADRPEQIILATNFGLIFSEDNGATWLFSCEDELSAYAGPYLLGALPSHRIFAIAGAGLIYSDDDACGWQAARGTLSNVIPYAFTIDPSSSQRVYVVGVPRLGSRDGDKIYVSNDGGVSFGDPVFTSPERSAVLNVLVAPSQPRRLFASMFSAPENHPMSIGTWPPIWWSPWARIRSSYSRSIRSTKTGSTRESSAKRPRRSPRAMMAGSASFNRLQYRVSSVPF
jgi:hypothetical protein